MGVVLVYVAYIRSRDILVWQFVEHKRWTYRWKIGGRDMLCNWLFRDRSEQTYLVEVRSNEIKYHQVCVRTNYPDLKYKI